MWMKAFASARLIWKGASPTCRIFLSTTRCWRKTMDDETAKALKYLQLRGLLAHWDEYLALAQKQRFSPVRLLQYVLEQECKTKSEHARQLRLHRARIHVPFALETY